jgi:hypothetical protein
LPRPAPDWNALRSTASARASLRGLRTRLRKLAPWVPSRGSSRCAGLVYALALAAFCAAGPGLARADHEACIASHEEAQLMRLRGRYTAAHESLLRCTQMQCPALIAKDCVALLSEVEASLPSVVFAVSDSDGVDLADVRVSADGRALADRLEGRAVTLDPGVYTLRFEAAGHAPAEQTVTVLEGQKQRLLRVRLVPGATGEVPSHESRAPAPRNAPATARLTHTSYALGGSALAGLAAGIAAGVVGKQIWNECDPDGCSDDRKAQGRRLYIGADVAFAASAGLAVAATWLYFHARNKSKRERPSALEQVSARVHAGGAGLAWRSSF